MINDNSNSKDLDRLRNQLIDHLNWGPISEWHSSMFTELSENIYNKCSVMLSTATLKRFWGVVKYDGVPSISTLDTLSQFIGHENWRAFKLTKKKSKLRFNTSLPKKSFYVTIGFFLALFSIMLIANKGSHSIKTDGISFTSRPVTNTYPNSVVFDFNLNQIQSDHMRIQQYWDDTKTIAITPNQKQATGIYYFPGYFRAKLIIDDKSVAEHDLFLRSNGWLGTVEYEPVPKYFVPRSSESSVLTCTEEVKNEVTTSQEPVKTIYHYINDLGNVSGDNFTLEATIKSSFNKKWAVCQSAQIYVIGTEGAMIIPFSKIGCSSDQSLMLNDVFLDGKQHDLSAFGTDLSDYTQIQVKVRAKEVFISIHQSEIYRATYHKSMGRVVGLRFKFLGFGEVQSFTLLDQKGNSVVL